MDSNDDEAAQPYPGAVSIRRRDVLLASAAAFVPRISLGLEPGVETPDVAGQVPLTVDDAIGTTRAMTDRGTSVMVSPRGDRYAFMTITGDAARDGIHAVVYIGSTTSVAEAAPQVVARLFTRSLGRRGRLTGVGGVSQLSMAGQNVPTWIDEDNLGLRWEAEDGSIQVFRLQTSRSHITQVTQHSEDVFSFNFGGSGALIFEAAGPQDLRVVAQRQLDQGFAVQSGTVEGLLAGLPSAVDAMDVVSKFERFVVLGGAIAARKVERTTTYSYVSSASRKAERARFSPNGNLALIDGSPLEIPASWKRYTDPVIQRSLREHDKNPKDTYARELQQLFLLDIHTGESRPLWDAPISSAGAGSAFQLCAASWSPDSSRLVLGWTFLPQTTSDEAGLLGRAVAEVDVASGNYWVVPIGTSYGEQLTGLAWKSNDLIEANVVGREPIAFSKVSGTWREVASSPIAIAPSKSVVRIEIRESFERPPTLVALNESNGEEKLLLDLNPGLERYQLGRVEFINWNDYKDRHREARLYHPVGDTPDGKYPLVVQTSGYAPREVFSLYGPGEDMGLGPNAYAINIAQLIANRGIGVLQLSFGPHHTADTAEAADDWAAMVVSAVQHLVQRGSVVRDRVGLMGFSIAGRYAEHALAFSDYPYAAAAICDHADVNYLQSAIFGWETWRSDWYGASPFGLGIGSWLSKGPSFNVERIRTPIQYSVCDHSLGNSSVLWPWEMFSRLRAVNKPVEFYVVPDVARGSHNLQNPRQLRALQSRLLDWWLYWLRDEIDADPSKVHQYASWNLLKNLHLADVQTSRPPRYTWCAQPIAS